MHCTRQPKPCPICRLRHVVLERTLNSVELVRCTACDFTYANLSDQVIEQANFGFDHSSVATYEEYQTLIDVAWFESIAKRLTKLVGRGRVLDIGCGNGQLLKQFISRNWAAEGLDPSPWATEFAQDYGYELHGHTLGRAHLPSDYFDAVTSTSTLEHITKPPEHVREVMRIVKPGGVAYFAGIPNHGSLAVKLRASSFDSNMPPEHANYFTRESLTRLFSAPGLPEQISRLSMRTYGIPELHRVYWAVQDFVRGCRPRPSETQGRDDRRRPRRVTSDVWKPALKKLFAVLLISGYYYLGRPFNLGDKLEAIAVKRA
jgi:SAM-dependent methyltransferase